MDYTIKSNKVIMNKNNVEFPFPIKKVIEFEHVLIVFVYPKNKDQNEKYKNFYDWKLSRGPVYAISDEGKILWQWKTSYVGNISKVPHKSSIVLLDPLLRKQEESKYDLLIHAQGWNFYVDPKTGRKISEEQTR